jgi:hypothetical protein
MRGLSVVAHPIPGILQLRSCHGSRPAGRDFGVHQEISQKVLLRPGFKTISNCESSKTEHGREYEELTQRNSHTSDQFGRRILWV